MLAVRMQQVFSVSRQVITANLVWMKFIRWEIDLGGVLEHLNSFSGFSVPSVSVLLIDIWLIVP